MMTSNATKCFDNCAIIASYNNDLNFVVSGILIIKCFGHGTLSRRYYNSELLISYNLPFIKELNV